MTSYYWIKLYDEILDDPKMGRLSDGAFRLCINLFLLANRHEARNGRLPDIEDIPWLLRLSQDSFCNYWQELESADIVHMTNGEPSVKHFEERQTAMTNAERQKRFRERQKQTENNGDETQEAQGSNEEVTGRYTDKEEDKEIDIDTTLPDGNVSANADYQAVRQRWIELFPAKPKPRAANKTLSGKVRTRMRDKHFQEHWERGLVRASKSSFLLGAPWFDLAWYLKNDDHYERCLNGRYDDKSTQNGHSNGRSPSIPKPAPAHERIPGAQ